KGDAIEINSSVNNLWKVVLKNNVNGKEYAFIPEDNFTIDQNNNAIHFVVNDFSVGNKKLPIVAEFTISVKDDAFAFSGSLKSNSEEWMIKELDYPRIFGIMYKRDGYGIYWPVG